MYCQEWFSFSLRCLRFTESSPMSARNFPPSFWNQSSVSASHHSHSELYGESMYHGASAHTAADPWHSHYQQYTAAAHHHR